MGPSAIEASRLDREEKHAIMLATVYLGRILERFPMLDRWTLQFVFWLLGPEAQATWDYLAERAGDDDRERFLEDLAERDDDDDAALAVQRLLRHQRRVSTAGLLAAIQRALRQRADSLRYRGRSDTERSMRRVQRMLGLSAKETELCFMFYIFNSWPKLEGFFEGHLDCNRRSGNKYTAAALGITTQELTRILRGKLARLGVIDGDSYYSVGEEYVPLLANSPEDLLAQGTFRRAPKRALPLSCHQVAPAHTAHLLSLLAQRPADRGTHILLYGPPGTGKSSYAYGLAKQVGGPAFEVLPSNMACPLTQRTAVLACLNMTNHGEGSLVIVDEADRLLETRLSLFTILQGDTSDKGWLNHLLDRPGLRMIWICNSIRGIDESVRRRFAFSVAFERFKRRQRKELWQNIARSHRVRRWLRDDDAAALASEYKLGAGAIDIAVHSAKLTAPPSRAAFLQTLRTTLEAHRTLLDGGRPAVNKDAVADDFCLEAVNANLDLDGTLRRLALVDQKLRAGRRTVGTHSARAGGMNLLFHGPPGTGKSELARYIAHRLDREPIVRRGSDLISKWLGETEQGIARAFAEAEREDAVLILDEVDTFLYARGMAQRSWEISSTNELLTQMERFAGILICTTNRLEGLDPASLRRFQVKAKLDYLTADGKMTLYRNVFAPLCTAQVDQATLEAVAALGPLAPGDFRVVADHHRLEPANKHAVLLAALEQECRWRQAQRGQRAGFHA